MLRFPKSGVRGPPGQGGDSLDPEGLQQNRQTLAQTLERELAGAVNGVEGKRWEGEESAGARPGWWGGVGAILWRVKVSSLGWRGGKLLCPPKTLDGGGWGQHLEVTPVLIPLLPCEVTSGKFLILCLPQFPYLGDRREEEL